MAQPALRVEASGEAEVVYRYDTDRCDWRSIPDSPARALRRSDGSLALIAGHFRNRVFEGRTFDDLRPNCALVSQGSESADPADFDDRFWIQALVPLGRGRVLALASHEYSGLRHPGACQLGPRGPSCWYTSIVALAGDEGDMRFALLPRDERIVAAAAAPFAPSMDAAGFLTASNVIYADDHGRQDDQGRWAHFVAWTEGRAAGRGRGNCLLRAPRTDLVSGWAALSGGGYRPMTDPYRDRHAASAECDPIGPGSLRGKVRSIVWLQEQKTWIAVYSTRGVPAGDGRTDDGVFYATSPDLRHWSAPSLLAPLDPPWGADGCAVSYDYPALIDQQSDDPMFQTSKGDMHLYMTRFNPKDCKRGMNRDLVRFRLTVH